MPSMTSTDFPSIVQPMLDKSPAPARKPDAPEQNQTAKPDAQSERPPFKW